MVESPSDAGREDAVKLWLRIALVAALAIALWILAVDLAKNVKRDGGSLEPAASAARLA